MILTFTPNPSIDSTIELSEAVQPGNVHRACRVIQQPGGKGVNVAAAVHLAQRPTLALFPAKDNDIFLHLVKESGLPFHNLPMAEGVRVNTTVTDPEGVTTKLNGPGPQLKPELADELKRTLVNKAHDASWVVLAGSLPGGVSESWYSDLIAALRAEVPDVRIALDTSDGPMRAVANELHRAAPDVIKPNGMELGQLADVDGLALEHAAATGDYEPVISAARLVVARGIPEVLVTLGAAGAVLVTADNAWIATPPPSEVRSTVGAGDAALAGYILARSSNEDYPAALARSVAYGTAATALPGTQFPSPDGLDIAGTVVTPE